MANQLNAVIMDSVIALRCMIHGPCGSLNPGSPCMSKGNCTKRYPKDYPDVTTDSRDGYPCYRCALCPFIFKLATTYHVDCASVAQI